MLAAKISAMNSQMVTKNENMSENELEDEEDGEEEDDEEDNNRLLIDSKLFASTVLSNKQGHKCVSCNKNFTTNNLMLQHYSAVHEKKRFPCGYCRETFAYRSGRTRHIHSVHQKLRFKCTLCKLTYTSRETAQMHVKTKHKIKEKIDLYLEKLSGNNNDSSLTPTTKSSPVVVQKKDQQSNVYVNNSRKKSDILPKLQPANHVAHQNGYGSVEKAVKTEPTSTPPNSNSASSASKERLKCYLCDKTFAYNAGRSKHIRIVHMNVRYRCMLCHSSYTTRDYAVQHVSSAHCIDSKHPVDYVERIQEDLPQSATSNKPPINEAHQEDFEDEISQDATDDFEEEDDEMNGLQQPFTSILDVFQTTNSTPERPAAVVGGNNLPFHCLQCGVGYETQELLMYHVNLEHEEQKIFCDYCGKSLLRPASLVGHMKEAHKDISYRCSMCGAIFACPADGSYHIEEIHQCDPAEHLEHIPTCSDA